MRVRLSGGAYSARSIIAGAQRQVNLYSEKNPDGAIIDPGQQPGPIQTLYPTPGTRLIGNPPTPGPARGLYPANNGTLYYVCGATLYAVSSSWTLTALGTIGAGTTPVSMADNGQTMVLVDGSPSGYQVELAGVTPNAFSAINGTPYMSSDATNLLLNSATLVTQTVAVTQAVSTLSFTGTGTVALSGAYSGGIVGTGVSTRVAYTFTPKTGALVCTVTGSVVNAQLEAGASATAYIATLGAAVTRAGAVVAPPGNAPQLNTSDPAASPVYGFYGADKAAVVDGFLLFNQPGTANFYCTYNGLTVFDSLYIAAKNGYSDNLVSIAVNQRVIWLIGERTSEIWFDAGNADFPFAIMPGPFVQHGCVAKYSVAQLNEAIYWLSQNQAGRNICVRTQGYNVNRISTHAIEAEWSRYATTTDAVGHTFQFGGHPTYQITFPTADRTWRFDEATGEWHEAVWLDSNGTEHRHRSGAIAHAYGQIVAADWQTGALYALDPDTYTDNGRPVVRRRGFPHLVADGKRVFYRQFLLDIASGDPGGDVTTVVAGTAGGPSLREDLTPLLREDMTDIMREAGVAASSTRSGVISLRYSDDRGRSYGNPVTQAIGATGEYLTSVQFQRLGMARDRVFEISWSLPTPTALQGAWLTLTPAES